MSSLAPRDALRDALRVVVGEAEPETERILLDLLDRLTLAEWIEAALAYIRDNPT